jgi:oligosaccharyltransferase complex subunit beta
LLTSKGIAQDIDEDSPVLFPVISGYSTTYSSTNNVIGKKVVLVSALQARNNARVVLAGSLDMFSDK